MTLLGSSLTYVFASVNLAFTMVISSDALIVDIVDGSYNTVASPTVAMDAVTMSFSCQTATGIFGTDTEVIYINNPDAADNGWIVSLAASDSTDVWSSISSGASFDFNDPTADATPTAGCADDTSDEADTVAGQMTVNPDAGTLTTGQCTSCSEVTGMTKWSSDAFEEGVTDTITILTGAAGSNDIGYWKLTGVAISQTIPAEQLPASDYSLDLTLSIVMN